MDEFKGSVSTKHIVAAVMFLNKKAAISLTIALYELFELNKRVIVYTS